MSFFVRPGLVVFVSDEPGAHATLFLDGERLHFRGDASSFDDEKRKYEWAFDHAQPLQDGQRFVFATADRAVVGAVSDGAAMVAVGSWVHVVRDGDGKPVRVHAMAAAGDSAPSRADAKLVEALVDQPGAVLEEHPRPRTWRSPKVSVFTCSYNRPGLLRAAVESLRRQTDQDWEHLIYDDASTSEEVEEVLDWAARDPRVRVFRRPANIDRPAVLWNYMLDRAHGRYFTALDDDNEKLPQFVEVMSGELDADPSLGIVTCGFIVIRDDGSREAEYHINLSTCVSELDRISTCDGGAMLYRREVFERAGYFSEALRTNEDWDWLRRAIRVSTHKNLRECHSTYRSHKEQRMKRCGALGNDADVARVKQRVVQAKIGIRVFRPPRLRLTRSQEDAAIGIGRGLRAIPWVAPGKDLAIVISPFQMSAAEVAGAVAGYPRALSIHMEDPYALAANLDRVRAMIRACREVWVCTNDEATVPRYRDIVGDRVIVCPSLSADSFVAAEEAERDIDVLLCGYAYPSRKRFVAALLPMLRGLRVVLVGDGWKGSPVETMATQDLEATYALHARAKAVVCLHRVHGDCSDGPMEPATVNRGFMEGFLGPRVFLDCTRNEHSLTDGDVVWYHEPGDLAGQLHTYLAGPRCPAADAFAEKCAALYTYRVRMARVLNCVRAPRFLARIP